MWVETAAARDSGDTEGRSHLGVRNQLGLLCLKPLCRRKRRLLQASGPSGAGHVRVDDHVARDHASLDKLEHREVLGRYEVDAVHLQGVCGASVSSAALSHSQSPELCHHGRNGRAPEKGAVMGRVDAADEGVETAVHEWGWGGGGGG